ncbi:MAG: bifunctional methionine sulfoxide reductase B/A protein [Kiritimatiellae bacterium]|nr:bifunctional methionine sulfoxide reductase B/A protein [Kiritimatiellia bacterium]
MLAEPAGAQEKNKMKTWRKLTPDEEEVIVKKGTERPFSGRFYDFYEPGVYVCRRCGAALYRSADKFKAKCGWPSFDAEIPGAVLRRPDADGQRTEILCAHCEAHLGHVFSGERLTPRNTRHCVNSLSMDFVPRADLVKYFERAIFAGGCFWGVEYYMEEFPGVAQTTAGYTGGRTERPSYEEVCGHKTGHAEAVEALYDPRQTSYEKLARLFFEIHDPTQLDRQGPDMGDQYRSNIFYVSAEQKKTAEKLIGDLKEKGWDVVTRLDPAGVFWRAEDYHQRYYRRNGMLPGCHRPEPRFDKGPEILRP